jgi:hypothetical protein
MSRMRRRRKSGGALGNTFGAIFVATSSELLTVNTALNDSCVCVDVPDLRAVGGSAGSAGSGELNGYLP